MKPLTLLKSSKSTLLNIVALLIFFSVPLMLSAQSSEYGTLLKGGIYWHYECHGYLRNNWPISDEI